MRVVIATTFNPFVEGGSTNIVSWLDRILSQRGHEVETFWFPFDDSSDAYLEQMYALRLLDLSTAGDRLICIRTPSHVLRHPNKVCWFIHHYRSAYDLWGTPYQTLPNTPEGAAYRDAIIRSDDRCLRECRKLFSNSAVVKDRLKRFNEVDAEVLYPPLLDPSQFRAGTYGDYLLYFSRLTHHKRQWLAIEALQYTRTQVRLVIAGATDPDCGPYVEELRRLIARYRLGDRVTLIDSWVSDEDKVRLHADALACLYFPFDEDSYGYPSLEAHAAQKAVISTTDSGGTRELIVDGENGFLSPSDPQIMAEAMDRLFEDRALAQRMGQAGLQRVKTLGIDWDTVVRRLLQ